MERGPCLSGKKGFMKGFLERGSCHDLSGKGSIPVWKGVHACLERGPYLFGKGFMPVSEPLFEGDPFQERQFMPVLERVHTCPKGVYLSGNGVNTCRCLERGPYLSGKGFMPVLKGSIPVSPYLSGYLSGGVHACLERGSCMPVWKGVHTWS